MVNQVKRKSLKAIAGAVAGTAAMSQIPTSLASGMFAGKQAGLSITHVETVFGQTVFIENRSDELVKLESLRPGRFATPSGEFDMGGLLQNGGLVIEPATTQAHNVSNDGRVHNWAVWDTLESSSGSYITDEAERPVDVFVYDKAVAGVPRSYLHYGQFG